MNNHEISLPLAPMLFNSPEIRQGMNSTGLIAEVGFNRLKY